MNGPGRFGRFVGFVGFCVTLTLSANSVVSAQTPADPARLVVTVTDQTGGVIPNATVTVMAQDSANAGVPIAPATTAQSGIATIESLKPGRYTIQAEFPGFEKAIVRDVRVGASGNVRRTVVLPIKKVAEDVTVGRDKQILGARSSRQLVLDRADARANRRAS